MRGARSSSSSSPSSAARRTAQQAAEDDDKALEAYYALYEEAAHVMNVVQDVLKHHRNNVLDSYSEYNSGGASDGQKLHEAQLEAFSKYLQARADGSVAHLLTLEWLRFGSTHRRMIAKLCEARAILNTLRKALEDYDDGDDDDNGRSIVLLQTFISEQLTPFKRFLLKQQGYHGARWAHTPESVDPIVWIIAWVVIYAIVLFFFFLGYSRGASSPATPSSASGASTSRSPSSSCS